MMSSGNAGILVADARTTNPDSRRLETKSCNQVSMMTAQILSGVPTFGQQESVSRVLSHAEFAPVIPTLRKI